MALPIDPMEFQLSHPGFAEQLTSTYSPQIQTPPQTISEDPYLNQALLTLGAGLLRSTPPGGSSLDTVSDAFMNTLKGFQAQRAALNEQAYKEREFGLKQQGHDLDVAQAQSSTALKKAQADYYSRMPVDTGAGSKTKAELEKWDLARKTITSQYEADAAMLSPEQLAAKYPGGLTGALIESHTRLFRKPPPLEDLYILYENEKLRRQAAAAKAKDPMAQPGRAVEPASSVEGALQQAQQAHESQQRTAATANIKRQRLDTWSDFMAYDPETGSVMGGPPKLTMEQAQRKLGELDVFMKTEGDKLAPKQLRGLNRVAVYLNQLMQSEALRSGR